MANIQNVRGVHSPQKSYMWEIDITTAGAASALSDLSTFAKTVSIPQTSVETFIINHKTSKTHHAGRDASGHTVSVTFWDDEALTIQKYFNDWIEAIKPQKGDSSVSRDQYIADMKIRLKDSSDEKATGVITLSHVFPTDIGDISLSYDGSEAIEVTITFSFDTKEIS